MNDDDALDAALMERLARGDTPALGELYVRHARAVLRFLTGSLRDEATAEDLCQEVFLTLRDTASRYEHRGQLRSWLLGIAAQKARAWRRRRWVRQRLLGLWLGSEPTHAQPPEPSVRDAMESALAQLPDELREVLLLQVGEGLSGAQIAEALGIQHGAVRVRLHRARERLRALLEAADTAPGGAS